MDPRDEEIAQRLRKIEGQVRGLLRMVEEQRDCEQILTQVLAVRAALDGVARGLVRNHVDDCLAALAADDAKARIVRAVQLLARLA